MPLEILPIAIIPATALPTTWVGSAVGALLVFMFPWGLGIPVGVLMARDAGLGPLFIASLYLMAYSARVLRVEAGFWLVRWLTARFHAVQIPGGLGAGPQLVKIVERMSGQAGLQGGPLQRSLLTVLVAFAVSPTAGRITGALAGFSLQRSWALTIAGDMVYFTMLMGSTLWLSDTLGNDRLVAVIMLGAAVVLPMISRKLVLRKVTKPRAMVPGISGATMASKRNPFRLVPALATIALLLSLGLTGARA